MTVPNHVLIIDSDPCELKVLRGMLCGLGYFVTASRSTTQADQELQDSFPNICIIDIDVLEREGHSFTTDLQNIRTGIIISGPANFFERAMARGFQADDYIAKPFDTTELDIRIRKVLRSIERTQPSEVASHNSKVQFGPWSFNIENFELTSIDGRLERLTTAEATVLMILLKSPNRILSRDQLLNRGFWRDVSAFERSVDITVSRIRKKIESNPRSPQFIKTVYGAGYMFAADVIWLDAQCAAPNHSRVD